MQPLWCFPFHDTPQCNQQCNMLVKTKQNTKIQANTGINTSNQWHHCTSGNITHHPQNTYPYFTFRSSANQQNTHFSRKPMTETSQHGKVSQKNNYKVSPSVRNHCQRSPRPTEIMTSCSSTCKCNAYSNHIRRKTDEVLFQILGPTEKLYSDLTGKFTVQLDRDNK